VEAPVGRGERKPATAVEAARTVQASLRLLDDAFSLLVAAVDLEEGTQEDAAELISAANAVGEFQRRVRDRMKDHILEWFLQNKARAREVVIGDVKYFGEKEKKVKCRDVVEAGLAVSRALFGDKLWAAVFGDEVLFEAVMGGVKELFQRAISSDGLMQGACREILAADAVEQLRRELAESGAELTAEQVANAEAAAFAEFFEESWPDGLGKDAAAKKLGVANLRFVYRKGGHDAKYFKELEARAAAARQQQHLGKGAP
jgi:hypothetical protein